MNDIGYMKDGFETAVVVEAIFVITPVVRMLYVIAAAMSKMQHGKTMSHSVAGFCSKPL